MSLVSARRPWLAAHAALVYAFLFAPVAVLVVFSFSASRYAAVWGGFTLDWYARLAGNERLMQALFNSLAVAAVATAIATVLGTAAALALSRARARSRTWLGALVYAPLVMPELVQGIALLMLFVLVLPLPLGLIAIAIGHSVFGIAYVTVVVGTRLHELDPNLEEAARDLGASRWQTFARVTLPLIWPGMLGGALLAFTLSFDDFVIAFFLTGPGASTLPIEIYSMVKRGVTPEINALATLILAVSVIFVALSLRVQRLSPTEGN
jgi:spermidine/putrescine transport system permease protein